MAGQPICPRCTRTATAGERFCAECGTPLFAAAQDAGNVTSAVTVATNSIVASPGAATGFAGTTVASGESAAGMPFAPGRQIGSRYTIIKLLGRGGMGAVYQAWDDELMVAVAIKVILPDSGDDAGTRHDVEQRFKRELLLARQVSHKNVVRIHDIGDVDGTKYITMSFLEGETLAALLARDRRLPVAQTLALARQVAEGLAAAHDVGVIHRDLKPENIMITPDGQAVIMDFGIARSAARGTTQTQAGTVMGTLEYMAPEQATAQPLDERVDVYALGLIVYDMLVGRTRGAAHDTPMTEMMARLQRAPASPRSVRAELPEPVDALVMRCIQPNPDARFRTAREFLEALGTLTAEGERRPDALPPPPASRSRARLAAAAAIAAIVAGALTGAALWRSSGTPAPERRAPLSVLIADFENRTGDPVFDGVVEQALSLGVESASFITAYPRRDALRVAATIKAGSALDEPTAHLIALREGVINRILAGSVEPRGAGYRITARVVTPGDQQQTLSTIAVDADTKATVLQAVGTLTDRVRTALGDAESPPDGSGTRESFTAANLEAARAYAAAQELQYAGRREEAIAQYQEAIRLDPTLGRAYSGLAVQYVNIGRIDEAEAYYQRALALLDRMTPRERFRTLGSYYLFARKPEQALAQYEALLEAYPEDDNGLTNAAVARTYLRQLPQALELGRRAAARQPHNSTRRNNVALYALYAGNFTDAVTESDEAVRLNPLAFRPYVARALAELATGRRDEAIATYEKLAALSPTGRTYAQMGLADVALYEGRLKDAIALLTRGIEVDLADKNTNGAGLKRLALAEAHLARGDAAAAAREALTALDLVSTDTVKAAAGILLARAGRRGEAENLASTLETRLENDPQAYGRLVRAELALAEKNGRTAVERAREAQKMADTWLGRVILGRAYLQIGAFTEAYTELQTATQRRGEATAVFLDEVPTYRMFAPVHYYRGLAEQALGMTGAGESFRTFLAIKARGDEVSPLVADARRRVQ